MDEPRGVESLVVILVGGALLAVGIILGTITESLLT